MKKRKEHFILKDKEMDNKLSESIGLHKSEFKHLRVIDAPTYIQLPEETLERWFNEAKSLEKELEECEKTWSKVKELKVIGDLEAELQSLEKQLKERDDSIRILKAEHTFQDFCDVQDLKRELQKLREEIKKEVIIEGSESSYLRFIRRELNKTK